MLEAITPLQAVGAAAAFFAVGYVAGLARAYVRKLVQAA
jgi:hypothetical protein